MKRAFPQSLLLLTLALCLSASAYAQGDGNVKGDSTAKAVSPVVRDATPAMAITATTTPMELARVALAAHGGEKFKTLKNMVLRGSADLYAPNSTRSLPGGFLWVIAGDKLWLEVDARPIFNFKQIYDGQQSYSSLPGVEVPPASKFGLPLLAKFEQEGYSVRAIPDNKKKQRGFRITDADGNITDFFLDSTTGRVMTFFITLNGYTFATEHDKFKEVDGVLVPTSFSQRLETPQGAFFAEYKVKDVKLNQALGDDVFIIPN